MDLLHTHVSCCTRGTHDGSCRASARRTITLAALKGSRGPVDDADNARTAGYQSGTFPRSVVLVPAEPGSCSRNEGSERTGRFPTWIEHHSPGCESARTG